MHRPIAVTLEYNWWRIAKWMVGTGPSDHPHDRIRGVFPLLHQKKRHPYFRKNDAFVYTQQFNTMKTLCQDKELNSF